MDKDDLNESIELDAKGWPTKKWLEQAYLEKELSILAIAQMTGRASSKIWVLLDRYNIPRRQPTERIDRDWLEQKYVVEKLPVKDIAIQAETNPYRIGYLIRAYGFPLKRPVAKKERPTCEWLKQKYIVEGMSSKQLCELTGYSKNGMTRLLRSYGIEAKGQSIPKLDISREELYQLHVVEGLTAVRIAQRFDCHNSAISRLIKEYNLDPGRPLVNVPTIPPLTRDELWKLYWVNRLSLSQIAKQYDVSTSTAARWFQILNVPKRNWNGGEFKRTYNRAPTPDNRFGNEFTPSERHRIICRDNVRCRMPGCKNVTQLEVHYIIAIKHGGTNALDNGITLCHDCHESIKFREHKFATLFQELLSTPPNN